VKLPDIFGAFCSRYGGKFNLEKPMLLGEYIWATDGRWLVRIPAASVDDAESYRDGGPKAMPLGRVLEVWDRAGPFADESISLPAVEHLHLVCPECNGRAYVKYCPECQCGLGKGGRAVCPNCEEGWYWSEKSVEVGPTWLDPMRIHVLKRAGITEVRPSTRPFEMSDKWPGFPVYFAHPDGWEGVLAPCKPPAKEGGES
jgi:hypothetical protein